MASGTSPEVLPEEDVQIISVERPTFPSPSAVLRSSSLSDFVDPGRENDEPFGSLLDEEALNCTLGLIDDQMLMDVLQENNVIDRRTDEKVLLPQPVEDNSRRSAENIDEDEIQVIFEGVKRPRIIQNKATATQAKELKKLTVSNGRLTKENESLHKELEDLKLEVAHQKSRNFLAQHEHNHQVLEVLNSELTCVICSDIIIEAVTIECGHIFCSHCISTWFTQQAMLRSCPTCRTVTYRDPIKISNLNSTIASFHTLLSQEVQSDRQQLIEERKADQKKAAQEASARRSQTSRNSRRIYLDLSGLTGARITRSLNQRLQRVSPPDPNASGGNSAGQGQATSAQAQPHPDHHATLPSTSQSRYSSPGRSFNIQAGFVPASYTYPSSSSFGQNANAPIVRSNPLSLALQQLMNQAPPDPISNTEEIQELSAPLPQGPPLASQYDYYIHPDPQLRPY